MNVTAFPGLYVTGIARINSKCDLAVFGRPRCDPLVSPGALMPGLVPSDCQH